MDAPHQKDSFSSYLHSTLGSPGQSGLDLHAQSPSGGIRRTFEGGRMTGKETKDFSIPERWVIKGGCCVGLGEDGLVRPALLEYDLEKILGFCIRTIENNRVAVRIAGSVLLMVEELTPTDAGKTVFAIGPNTFTLAGRAGGLPLGEVQYVQDGRAMVSFGVQQKDSKEFHAAGVGRHY